MSKPLYYDSLVESLKDINTDKISDDVYDDIKVNIEKQNVYIWIRLYLKEELSDIEKNDIITINYKPSDEKLETIFIAYGKQGIIRNEDSIIEYIGEDDRKVLTLMANLEDINYNEDVKTISSLFTHSRYYDNNILLKRSDLEFRIKRNDKVIEYIQFSDN